MRTVVIENCTVELHIPSLLEMSGVDGPRKEPRVKLTTLQYIHDVQVKMPDGKVVTIKKLLLRDVLGMMMPVVDEITGNAVLFTVDPSAPPPVEPDAVHEMYRDR